MIGKSSSHDPDECDVDRRRGGSLANSDRPGLADLREALVLLKSDRLLAPAVFAPPMQHDAVTAIGVRGQDGSDSDVGVVVLAGRVSTYRPS